MPRVTEAYRRLGNPDAPFDLAFRQSQGEAAIFRTAL